MWALCFTTRVSVNSTKQDIIPKRILCQPTWKGLLNKTNILDLFAKANKPPPDAASTQRGIQSRNYRQTHWIFITLLHATENIIKASLLSKNRLERLRIWHAFLKVRLQQLNIVYLKSIMVRLFHWIVFFLTQLFVSLLGKRKVFLLPQSDKCIYVFDHDQT